MKIVHVLPALTKGGAERVAVDLANASVAAGHDVAMILAYPVDPGLLQDDLDSRIEVRFCRANRSHLGSYASIFPWIVRNRKWLGSFDILHCHLTFGSVFAEAVQSFRGKDRRPRIVETYHAVGTPVARHKKIIHRWLAARHDGFVTMAEDRHWARFLAAHPELLSAFIPNGVDPSPARPDTSAVADVRSGLGIPPDALVFGTIGRLKAERHPQRLMDVFIAVAQSLPGLHILIGGDGPERQSLAKRAADAGLTPRVHLPGLIRNPRTVQAAMDLYLTLNVGSITGIAALEASALDVPLIAYQADPSYRPTTDDWIPSSAAPSELAGTASELLRDEDGRRALAARQKQLLADRFSTERMVADYHGFYERLLADGRLSFPRRSHL